MSTSSEVDKIVEISVMTAKAMGLDASLFEKALRSNLDSQKYQPKKPRRTYTLEFLKLLTEKGGNQSLDLNKIGTELPRQNPNSYNKKFHKHNEYLPMKETIHVPRGENAWTPGKDLKNQGEAEIKLKKIRSDLNKISPENEKTIATRICEEISEECISELVPIFFDKGIWEQKYREIYARICSDLNKKFPKIFIAVLCTQCQKEFEVQIDMDADDEIIVMAMKRRIGAIHFILEMLRVRLLTPPIIFLCIEKILKPDPEEGIISEYDICHTAELLITVIPIFKKGATLKKLSPTIKIMKELDKNQFVSQRAKFKIEDVIKVWGNV
jgi:hypothetical protein